MEIDKFYTDYSKLWTLNPNLSPQELRDGMDELKSKYPFMDTVLLSRRTGPERDTGLAYNVLTRIPPGDSARYAEAAGIPPELFDKFFTDKGAIDKWNAADRQRFMSGVITLSAVLEIPDDMTRGEWVQAKNAYTTMQDEAKDKFGTNILDKYDAYFQAKKVSSDAAETLLERNPQVEQFMNWRAQSIMGSPLLS